MRIENKLRFSNRKELDDAVENFGCVLIYLEEVGPGQSLSTNDYWLLIIDAARIKNNINNKSILPYSLLYLKNASSRELCV